MTTFKSALIFTLLVLFFVSCHKKIVTASFSPNKKGNHKNELKEMEGNHSLSGVSIVSPVLVDLPERKNNRQTIKSLRSPVGAKTKPVKNKLDNPQQKTGTKKEYRTKRRLVRLKKKMDKRHSSLQEEPSFSVSALVSFLYGVISLYPVFALFAVPASLVAGFHTLQKMKNNPEAYRGKGWAIAGIALGFLGLLIGVLVLGLLFFFFSVGF